MSENELILMILFLAALLAVFILAQKKIELEIENDALWKQVYMNDIKARSWDKLFDMVKDISDSVNVVYDHNLITFQHSEEGYWVLLTNTSEYPIVGSTPSEVFMRHLRGR